MDFLNSLAWLTFFAVMFTLLAVLVGLLLTRGTTFTHNSDEPWALTKLEGNLWMLKRKNSVLATIHGIIIEDPEDTLREEQNQSTFLAPSNESKYFKNETTTLIRVNTNAGGASFSLYYEEHEKMKDEPVMEYQTEISDEDLSSSRIQVWKTNLY